MAVFVLPKWSMFNEIARPWKSYQEFLAKTQQFARQSVDDPTKQEVLALAPWRVQWLVDDDCESYDSALTTTPIVHYQPPSVYVPPNVPTNSVATLRHFSPDAFAMLTDLTEARPLVRTELNVKTRDGEQLIPRLVECVVTLDSVSEDLIRMTLFASHPQVQS
jgi:hypothetical protein